MRLERPKMVIREQNSVLVCWKSENGAPNKYILQIRNVLNQWETIYWGSKTEFKVTKLAPCTCYTLQIRKESDIEWQEFKIATLDGPFQARHLTRAIKFAKTSQIRKIISSKPHLLEVENKESKTPLFQAIEKNDFSIVSLLVTLGANVNGALMYNLKTPLIAAFYLGHLAIANFLIEKGANIYATDINGLGVLAYAVAANCLESVKQALAQNVDVNSTDNKGFTALLRAVILGCDQEIVDFLLQNDASLEICDKNGFNFQKHLQLLQEKTEVG